MTALSNHQPQTAGKMMTAMYQADNVAAQNEAADKVVNRHHLAAPFWKTVIMILEMVLENFLR